MARKVAPPGQLRSDLSPSKVPGFSRPAAFPSPGPGSLSWRPLRFRVLCVASYRVCRVDPIPPGPRRFRRARWSSAATGPRLLAKTGSSSRVLRSPPEFLLAFTCLRASPPQAPSVGFHPSSRHQLEESTHRRASQARLRSARSVSHALDGLLLPQPCAPVSSRCRVQGSRSRGLLPRSSRITSSVTDPLAPLAPPPAGCPAPANVASTSGSCSGPWSVVSSGWVRPVRPRSPPAFSTPSGVRPKILGAPSRPLRSRPSRSGATCPPHR
jgi:hypothetical protein